MSLIQPAAKVAEACKLASASVDKRADIFHHCQMGTTMVMASIQGNKITIAHIGDSRCYLLRPGYYDYEDILDVFDFLCERSGDDSYTAIIAIIE